VLLSPKGEFREPSDRKYHKPKPNNKSICELQNNKINTNSTDTLYVSLVARAAKVTNGLLVNE
jgi:hypothetical protein